MQSPRFFLLTALFVASSAIFAIDLTNEDFSWQYNPKKPIRVRDVVAMQDSTLTIFLEIKSLPAFQWRVAYYTQDNYKGEGETLITPKVDTLASSFDTKILKISLDSYQNLFLVSFTSQSETLYYDIAVSENTPDFYLTDGRGMPLFSPYLMNSDVGVNNAPTLFFTRYKNEFGEAEHPYAKVETLAPAVPEDSTFQSSSVASLKEGYFYAATKDTLTNEKLVFLKMPVYYPKYRKLPELIEAAFYIMTEQEKTSLIQTNDLKKTFDSFWVGLYQSKTRAKNAIKNYYDWVEYANYRFTDYKEG